MINVAIDGPAGAGKSTVAKAAAKELGYIYVDTGALYRTVALNAVRNSIIDDSEKIVDMLSSTQVELKYVDGVQAVYLNGEDVSSLIRTPEISMGASKVSAIPEVRAFLLDLQRDIAKNNNVIMDGRDIGTVVLPNAECKIYLTASSFVRANRRYKELIEKGETCDLAQIEKDIIARDEQDMNREIAPLKQAEDAVYLDASDLSIDEVVNKIIEIQGASAHDN